MSAGRTYIGVSAGAVIVNPVGQYFLAQRSVGARDDQGAWEFPGGSVRLFESREEAVRRNMADKYGLTVEIEKVLGIYDVVDPDRGDHWLSTTYVCHWLSGEGVNLIPDKCDGVGWFSWEDLRQLQLSRITKLNVRDLGATRGARVVSS